MFAIMFDFVVSVRVLGEDLAHQKLLRQRERFDFGGGDVHEFRFYVIENVVVSEEVVLTQRMADVEPLTNQWLLVKVVADADAPASNKVHFQHFIFFVVHNVFFFGWSEMPWFNSKSDIVEEFAVFVLVGRKEKAEVEKYIVQQVVHYDALSDCERQRFQEFIIQNLAESVLRPEIRVVLVDLAVKTARDWFVLSEASE